MGADGVTPRWEVYDAILAQAREHNHDVMRDAWIMRARHAVAETRALRAQTGRYRSAAERLMRLLDDSVHALDDPTMVSADRSSRPDRVGG